MASLKGQKALAPALMRVDGNGAFITDKLVLGASPGLGVPAAADTLDVLLLPAGAQLCDLFSVNDDMDSGAALLYSVGYRPVNPADGPVAVTDYFAAAGQTAFRAAGRVEYTFKPIQFEYDVYVSVLIGTAPAGITGNPELHFVAGIAQRGQK